MDRATRESRTSPRMVSIVATLVVVGVVTLVPTVQAEAADTLTLQDDASCQALKGESPNPEDIQLEWDEPTRTCELVPTLVAALRSIAADETLVVPDGVTLRTAPAGSVGGSSLGIGGSLINHGTLDVSVGVGGEATNYGTMLRGFYVRAGGTLTNHGVVRGGSIEIDGGIARNYGEIYLDNGGGIFELDIWQDRHGALTENFGLVVINGDSGLYSSHFIVESSVFVNYGTYLIANGRPMEVFDGGTFDNAGEFISDNSLILLNWEESPYDPYGDGVLGMNPGGGGEFIIRCGSSFSYPEGFPYWGDEPSYEFCDSDDDGVANRSDNCVETPNPDQADLNGDGEGDACDPDDDGDSVLDGGDVCPGTVLPEPAPPEWKANRYVAASDGRFTDSAGRSAGVTISDTGGCSGRQIVAAAGLGKSHLRYGITKSALQAWVASLS